MLLILWDAFSHKCIHVRASKLMETTLHNLHMIGHSAYRKRQCRIPSRSFYDSEKEFKSTTYAITICHYYSDVYIHLYMSALCTTAHTHPTLRKVDRQLPPSIKQGIKEFGCRKLR